MLARTLLHARSRLTAAPYACCPIVVTLVCYASARCSVSHAARLRACPALSNRGPLLTPPPHSAANNARHSLADRLWGATCAIVDTLSQDSTPRPYGRFARLRAYPSVRASLALPQRAILRAIGGGAKCMPVAAGRCAASQAQVLRTLRGSALALFRSAAAAARRRAAHCGGACCSGRSPSRQPSPRPPRRRAAPCPLWRLSGFVRCGLACVGLRSALLRACSGPPCGACAAAPPARGDRVRSGPRSAKKIRNPD